MMQEQQHDCPICYESMGICVEFMDCKQQICLACYWNQHERGATQCPMCRAEILGIQFRGGMPLFSTNYLPRSPTIKLAFLPTTTTLDLARMIALDTGLATDQQRLIFKHKQLPIQNNVTCADYGIESGDLIHLLRALRGD